MKKREAIRIEERDAIAIHDQLLRLHGGLRDRGLLESALARPQQHYSYGDQPGVVELAAVVTVGLIRNHPFVDGNKRVGFVVGVLFLELNGFAFRASEEDATQAVLEVAAGRLDESGYAAWLRSNVKRPIRR